MPQGEHKHIMQDSYLYFVIFGVTVLITLIIGSAIQIKRSGGVERSKPKVERKGAITTGP